MNSTSAADASTHAVSPALIGFMWALPPVYPTPTPPSGDDQAPVRFVSGGAYSGRAPGARTQHRGLRHAPGQQERREIGVAQVAQRVWHQAVAVVGPRAFVEAV